MRAGFVGTGNFADEHAKSLQRIGAQIVACYGTNRQKTTDFAARYGARVFDRPLELVSRGNIDALYLVVPPFACDGSVETKAISEGIPFLCEKPVGLDLARCRKIAKAIEDRGIVTASGYVFRHGRASAAMKEAIARNRISIIRACRMGGLMGANWRRSMEKSGGAMVDLGTHTVDLMRWLFGEIRSVAALAAHGICRERFESCDVYDSMDAQILFENGVIGNMAITSVMENGARKSDLLDVFGKDFMLSFNWGTVRYKEGANEWVEVPVEPDRIDWENRNFLEAIEAKDPSRVLGSYPDAVRTLAATLAMNQSAAEGGRRVEISSM